MLDDWKDIRLQIGLVIVLFSNFKPFNYIALMKIVLRCAITFGL